MAALAQASADTGIIEFKEGDNVGELLNQHDFSVVSFYNAEEWAAEIDKLMDGAKEQFEKKIADGEWSDRKIGWYRADLDKHPEFAVDEFGIPDQMVYNSQAGLTRFVHYLR